MMALPDKGDLRRREPDDIEERSDTPLRDWIEAENSRPTLPGETADGLDDMDEEIRREAEDIPDDAPDRENR